MNISTKKRTKISGIRIGLLYLIAFGAFIITAYLVLSKNLQNLMADYSLNLMQSMVEQGAETIENELQGSQNEITALAQAFTVPADNKEIAFPNAFSQPDTLRMVYVSENGCTASDGRSRDITDRQDIAEAFKGNTSFYGPYFNEENEYVICYSAPVYQDQKIAGVLSVEKDGYYFSSLIQNIRLIHSGESYIIDEKGTNIAVSSLHHLESVNKEVNAKKLLSRRDASVPQSIAKLERKGLAGEKGVGTYELEGSLYYLFYEPIPSSGWVFLGRLRQEDVLALIQSTLWAAVTKGPTLAICIAVFLLLTLAITFRITDNLNKSEQINEELEISANHDSLTGLLNRHRYHNAVENFSADKYSSFACIYIDVNGLHEINNYLGHQAGDKMLKCAADRMLRTFPQQNIYRIGGDEFVIFCPDCQRQETYRKAKILRDKLKKEGYEISIGIEWRDKEINLYPMLNTAERAMQLDKEQFYRNHGKERQMRVIDKELEQMILEKQDADTFLSVLAPEYKGVYFVNLDSDSIRHLYIPPYFEKILKETDYLFSIALLTYCHHYVMPEYQQRFEEFCDYKYLKELLNENTVPEFIYQKTDGECLKLQILKFKLYTEQNRETLWIFSTTDDISE